MYRSRRLQFSLRTLLLGMLVFGTSPWFYLKWRKENVRNDLATAKAQRDQALIAWRAAYEASVQDDSGATEVLPI